VVDGTSPLLGYYLYLDIVLVCHLFPPFDVNAPCLFHRNEVTVHFLRLKSNLFRTSYNLLGIPNNVIIILDDAFTFLEIL
jgi:hypothetical protein